MRVLAVVLLLAVAPVAAQVPETGVTRYQRAMKRPEAERVALAEDLAANADARARALLRAELKAATTPALRLALVQAIARHPHDDLVAAVAAVIDANDPDPDPALAPAVAATLVACGPPGVQALAEMLDRFATGRTGARSRAANQQAVLTALGQAKTDEAWAVLARASLRGVPFDRYRCLNAMAQAPPGPLTTPARQTALDGDLPQYVLEGLRQLAQHGPGLTDALEKVARAAKSDREKPLRTGIAQLAGANLIPDRFAVFFASAAIADCTLSAALASQAKALRANKDLADWVVAQRANWKSPEELALAARLAAGAKAAETDAFLVDLAQSKVVDAVEPALAALGTRRVAEAAPVLRRLLQLPPNERRRLAADALHAILRADPAWRLELRGLFGQDDLGLRLIALDCLADIDDQETLPKAHALFADDDWTVRAAAYDFARRVRAIPSIPLLLARLPLEKGRLREDVVRALRWLTDQHLRTELQWNSWWRDHAAWFELPPAPKDDPQPPPTEESNTRTYYSLELVSDAAIFIVDTSGSMEAKIGTGNERTRLMEAKRQLARVLDSTPATHRINVLPFSSGVAPMLTKLTPASADVKKILQAAVAALRSGGGTNVHAALQAAFADPFVDTIFLLTDGSPSAGTIVDPAELANEVQKWNRTRRITIHCISVGTDSAMLQRMAKESGGRYVRAR